MDVWQGPKYASELVQKHFQASLKCFKKNKWKGSVNGEKLNVIISLLIFCFLCFYNWITRD